MGCVPVPAQMQTWGHALAEALNSGLLYVYQALQCPMEALQGRGTLWVSKIMVPIRVILRLYWGIMGKENGNYYNGLYRDYSALLMVSRDCYWISLIVPILSPMGM